MDGPIVEKGACCVVGYLVEMCVKFFSLRQNRGSLPLLVSASVLVTDLVCST